MATSGEAVADPPYAECGQDDSGADEAGQLVALQRPVAVGGLLGHQFVIGGANLYDTVMEPLLGGGGHRST